MGLNAFIRFTTNNGKLAEGESRQVGFEKWTEIQGWDWEVEAESSWDKGSGASVGKPKAGKMNFEHYYDKSANIVLFYISSGTAFEKIELSMCKGTGAQTLDTFFTILMKDGLITKVSNSASEDGNVVQKVELVFKDIEISYKIQGDKQAGKLGASTRYYWSVPEGKATT